MKKILMIATTAYMIDRFEKENIKTFLNLGYEVHVVANFEKAGPITKNQVENLKIFLKNLDVKFFQVNFEKSPIKLKNIKAFKELDKIIKNNNYYMVDTHTPVGGVLGRIAAKKNNVPKIIYTAHGFHFFKGGPKKNWLIYYPIEKILSKITDVLITINNQDYNLAKTKLKSKKVYKINGVGIDTQKIRSNIYNREIMRKKLYIKEDEVVLLSVGELNTNKNHITIIKSIQRLENIKKIKYFICGLGPNKQLLENYIKNNNLENNVFLLGFKENIEEILSIADIFCFPSKREGLSVALIEAMAIGLPCVVSDIRGNNDLIDNQGGYLVSLNKENYEDYLSILITNRDLRKKLGIHNREVSKLYDKDYVMKQMKDIYNE